MIKIFRFELLFVIVFITGTALTSNAQEVGVRFGISGEIGLEYRFSSVPIAIGADWRPTLWVVGETKFGADSFGLNIRFVF